LGIKQLSCQGHCPLLKRHRNGMFAPTVEFWPVAVGAFALAAHHIVQRRIGLRTHHGAAIGHQFDVTGEHDLNGFVDAAAYGLGQGGLRPRCDFSHSLVETGPGERFAGGLLRGEIEFCYLFPCHGVLSFPEGITVTLEPWELLLSGLFFYR
jgi:hypothetical protein